MLIGLILSISVLLQLAAAVLSWRLIRVTGWRAVWTCIAAAVSLMAARRGLTLFDLLAGTLPGPLDSITETVALAISLLMVAGLSGIAPYFLVFKHTQEALKESEERFRTLVEHAPEALVILDVETMRFISANDNAVRLFGLPREKLYEVGPAETSAPVQAAGRAAGELAREMIQKAMKGDSPIFEWIHRDAAGKDIPCLVYLARLPAASRLLVRGSILDVTEHKRAERAILGGKKKLDLALRGAKMGVWEWDMETNRVSWSNNVEEIFHLAPGSFKGTYEAYLALLSPEDRTRVTAAVERTLQGNEDYIVEHRILDPEGKTHWLEGRGAVIRDEANRPVRMMGTVMDITERKQAEKALRESETRFRALFEQATVGVAEIDALTGRFLQVNQKYSDIAGYTIPEMLNLDFQTITHPDDLAEDLHNMKLLVEGKIREFTMEKRYYCKNGAIVWVNLTVSPLWAGMEAPSHHMAVVEDITERKRVEEALRENEQRLRVALRGANIAVFNQDRELRYTWMYQPQLGYASEEVIGRTDADLLPPQDSPRVMAIKQRTLETGSGIREEVFIHTPDKTFIYDLIVEPLRDAQGLIIGVTGASLDITEQKRVEETLRRSEARLRAIIDHEPECVKLVNRDGNLVEMNPAGLRMIEADSLTEVEGHCLFPLVVEEHREAFRRLHERVLQGESGSLVFDIINLKGNRRTLETNETPLQDPSGAVFAALGVTRDITERKQAEEVVRESEAFIRSVLEHLPNMVFVKDAKELRFVRLNKAGEELLGYRREALLGKNDYDLFPKEQADSFTTVDREVLHSNRLTDIPEEPIRTKDKGVRILHTQKIPIADETGAPRYLLGISEDITERKRAEEALRENIQRLRILSKRLVDTQETERRNIARELHDEIGQTLTGLKITLKMCADRSEKIMRKGVREAQILVDNLMLLVRDLSVGLRPAILDDLGLLPTLQWHVERYEAQTGVHVRLRHKNLEGRFEPAVETAAFRIIQEALTNVARHARVKEAQVRCQAEAGALRIKVEDPGAGFDPLKITRFSSGLAGMRERAEALGGSLTVASAPGSGVRLTVLLPLSFNEASVESSEHAEAGPSSSADKI